MIFTALGLLVLGAALFIAGIAKSSVPFLMLSLVATAAAGGALAIAYSVARRTGVIPDAPPVPQGAVVMYVPMDQLPAMAPAAAAMKVGAASSGNGNGNGSAGAPIAGYESMTADQVCKLVSSGAFSAEQLAALREYEASHGARKTVLERIDKAL